MKNKYDTRFGNLKKERRAKSNRQPCQDSNQRAPVHRTNVNFEVQKYGGSRNSQNSLLAFMPPSERIEQNNRNLDKASIKACDEHQIADEQ